MNGHGKRLTFDDESREQEPIGTVRVSVVQGRGLKIKEELFSIDVPDVYCEVLFDSDPAWKTSVKRNCVAPVWKESQDFSLLDHGQIITLNAWDKNEREFDPDLVVGSTKTTVGKLLLAGGSMELELKKDGRATGVHITLRCDMVE
jgi:Ca2+-dependent lipid-binding protein